MGYRMAERAVRVLFDLRPARRLIEREGLGLGRTGFEEERPLPVFPGLLFDLVHQRASDAFAP